MSSAEEGCRYGDNCNFLHDEHSGSRESCAIILVPGSRGGYGSGSSAGSSSSAVGRSPSTLKPPNWKTKICYNWQQTGHCPFGNKCNFAHGAAELHRYGGGLVKGEGREFSSEDVKEGVVTSKSPGDTVVASVPPAPRADGYQMRVPSQRAASNVQGAEESANKKWKGPNKISLIYGDWIENLE